jgi:RHS repeat-associated protein
VPNRHGSTGDYRYGFNGKEKDDEVMGEGNFEDYGMRMYNTRLGRFFSVDPVSKSYPMLTPYQFASNSPIVGKDLDGLEFYYAANGTYYGQGPDKDSKEVRLAKLMGTSKDGMQNYVTAVDINEKASKNWVVIHSNHDEFQQLAAVGYNENLTNASAQQATSNIVLNRLESGDRSFGKNFDGVLARFANPKGTVGATHAARLSSHTWRNYANFFKTDLFDRNEDSGMKSATMGAIKAYLGIDNTGGGTFEQGRDFFISTKKADGTYKWPANTDRMKNGFTWDTTSQYILGDYNTKTVQPNKGTKSGNYMWLGTASYSGNVFYKTNPTPNATDEKCD